MKTYFFCKTVLFSFLGNPFFNIAMYGLIRLWVPFRNRYRRPEVPVAGSETDFPPLNGHPPSDNAYHFHTGCS